MVAFEDFALDRVDDGPRDPREFVALLDELASAIEMGLWEWNVVTGAVWWSRGLFGIYGRAPPLGPPQDYALPHVHEQDRERVRAAIERSLAEGPYYARYRLIREDDGELRELEAFGRTFFSDGAPQRFIGVVFDVTTRARARELAEFRARLLDAVGQAVLATDSAGMIQYANLSCTRMFGWEPEQLIGLHIARSPMAPPSVREQVSEIVARLLSGRTWRGELLLTRKDGTRFPALVADSPVLDAQGEVTGMIGVAADITAQKRSELAARSAERLYRALFESPGQLIGLIELDGTVLMLNAQGAARLRVPPAEAIGRRLAELTPWAHELLMPRFAEVLARGESMVFEDTLTRAGELRYYVTNVMPVDIGERTVMQCVTSDISELRRAELALRESERQRLLDLEEFRAMFTSAPAMIHTVDADWRLTMVSDHWLDALGYTRAEVIGRRSFELLTPASRETARRLLPEFLATGAVSDIPHQIYKKSGEVMDVLLSATAERDARGRLTRSFAVLTDMTTQRRIERERLQLTQQLEHAQKLESLGVLAGGIAHDFNNLLTVIVGNVELAERALPPGAPARAFLGNALEATRRAASLAGEMLAYSGKGAFAVAPLDLSREVDAIANLLQTSIAKTSQLRVQLARALPRVMADAAQLHQVIVNLVTNASEALRGAPGEVAVRTFSSTRAALDGRDALIDGALGDGPYVCLEVRDDGCGMDRETQRRMFDPFFTTKTSGRGLGLAALQGIVRGHGGVVIVESARGRGTSITVCLPATSAARDDTPAPARATTTRAPQPARGPARVLIVDDEPEIRAVAQEVLASLGFDALLAADGLEAVELFAQHRGEFAFVLLDLTMPRMSGEQAFAAIRALDPNARIMFTSGYTDDQFVNSVIGTEAVAFLPKPYRLARARAAIDALLRDDERRD